MDEPKQGHPHTEYAGEPHPHRRPYWKRMHRDWKFWVALLALLFAMAVYVCTDNLALRLHGPPQQQVP